MIPISSKEFVTYTDPTDGVAFKFMPKSGQLEAELLNVWGEGDKEFTSRQKFDAFIDKILIEPKYNDIPSKVFNSEEKLVILKFWHEANKLNKEEKKS